LLELIGDWQKTHGAVRIYLSGMIGSRSGWQEIPYLSAPLNLDRLAAATIAHRTQNESGSFLASANPIRAT